MESFRAKMSYPRRQMLSTINKWNSGGANQRESRDPGPSLVTSLPASLGLCCLSVKSRFGVAKYHLFRAREMDQQLRAVTAVPEDQSSVSSIHAKWLRDVSNSISRGSNDSDLHGHPHSWAHIHMQMHN